MLLLECHEFDLWVIEYEIHSEMVEFFMNLHLNLFMSSSEIMQVQDLILRTFFITASQNTNINRLENSKIE